MTLCFVCSAFADGVQSNVVNVQNNYQFGSQIVLEAYFPTDPEVFCPLPPQTVVSPGAVSFDYSTQCDARVAHLKLGAKPPFSPYVIYKVMINGQEIDRVQLNYSIGGSACQYQVTDLDNQFAIKYYVDSKYDASTQTCNYNFVAKANTAVEKHHAN